MTNGITFTNMYSPVTVASNFTVLGVYTLQLTATDGMATNSSEMTVTVADPSSRTYTYDADFAEGELVNVNYDDVPDQLQLNQKITPFPFVWIACSDRATIVRIDANTGQILGEYRTVPQSLSASPSRTTVDKSGNVWVGNRCDDWDGRGSMTRVGLVIGGTRGYKTNDLGGTNFTFVPNPNGGYLSRPSNIARRLIGTVMDLSKHPTGWEIFWVGIRRYRTRMIWEEFRRQTTSASSTTRGCQLLVFVL